LFLADDLLVLILNPEDRGSTFIRKVSAFLPDYTDLHLLLKTSTFDVFLKLSLKILFSYLGFDKDHTYTHVTCDVEDNCQINNTIKKYYER
jgi:hypothetical protein